MEHILKILNDKIAEYESRIDYLRSENTKLNKELDAVKVNNMGLSEENERLLNEAKRQDAVISDLKMVNALEGVGKND
jgi:prefoldin subunit 5